MTSWGTVTLADEPSELLVAFCAYHARLGASEIHVFLDRTPPREVKTLSTIPGVIVTHCSPAFWDEHGGRPGLQTHRQDIVANVAYMDAAVDWLAHIDADEFIHATDDMGEELSAVPPGIVGLRMQTRERAWRTGPEPTGIFDGIFRKPIPGSLTLDRPILGPLARYTQRGLAGHAVGKSIVRTGLGLTMSIHAPKDPKSHHLMESQTMRILHFDGLTPLHWTLKRLKYAVLPHADKRIDGQHFRWNQIAAIRECTTMEEALTLQRKITCVPPEQEAQLRTLKLIEDVPDFDPAADIAAVLPDAFVQLSVRRFNRRILRKNAVFVRELGIT
ncbi:MAG: glycosyltransferase family 2 protein [Pseudomonadota bacterium]